MHKHNKYNKVNIKTISVDKLLNTHLQNVLKIFWKCSLEISQVITIYNTDVCFYVLYIPMQTSMYKRQKHTHIRTYMYMHLFVCVPMFNVYIF